ncbi:NADPH-dependent 7-cyano-7-deazaguanine reductase QueF [Hydrocarboniclastica marina]|nr:NADPH-dependent 7-cyano-7-deazaguanine reductase QueF [Hydrocarboniclastica marina]|tara:strand:+ start:2946 stop:3755 length:810 start_codon:yes stop_codon:yes gene_type:complete
MKDAPLGQVSVYPEKYSSELLYPVPRQANRSKLGLDNGWPWFGEDRWQAFELSWLGPNGVPRVAIGELIVPGDSPNIIESKSLKLYCNSFNQTVFDTVEDVQHLMARDLSRVAGRQVNVTLAKVDSPATLLGRPDGFALLDDLPVVLDEYEKGAGDLKPVGPEGEQRYCSHLLKSNCPVTGQPDWGSVFITLNGPKLDEGGLLAYIVGYRNTQDFHEHCVESIFVDIMNRLKPIQLTVSAQYTRRGGLDINPWRSTGQGSAPKWRLLRQ